MSIDTKSAEAISFAPIAPYQVQPESWLNEVGMTRGRYDEEMDATLDSVFSHLHPVFEMLNGLPETPELKVLKSKLNEVIRSPFIRPRNPMTVMFELNGCLANIVEYYHDSRGKKTKRVNPHERAQDIETLAQIDPQNINQRRAMVLLVLLKAKPKEALHTEDCKHILEGAEGAALDSTIVRRAMCVLAEIYNPRIIYEKVAGSYRVRANF
jgi:hypothetical protein